MDGQTGRRKVESMKEMLTKLPLSNAQLENLWALNTAMQEALPKSSTEKIREVALDFVRQESTEKSMQLIRGFRTITAGETVDVNEILHMDLQPAQLLLYVTSPQEEREELYQRWLSSWTKNNHLLVGSPTIRGQEMIDQGWRRSTSASSMVFLGVAAVTAPLYVAGLVFQNPDITETSIQTAQILSEQAFKMMKTIVEGSAMGLVAGALKVGHMANTYARDRRTANGVPKELETKLKALSGEKDASQVNGHPFSLHQSLGLSVHHTDSLLQHFDSPHGPRTGDFS